MLLAPTISALGLPPRSAIDRVRALGCRGVQLDARAEGTRPAELGESARRDLLGCIRRGSQVLTGIDLWIPVHAWSDESTVQRAVDATCSTIELAAGLGRCPVSLNLPDPDLHGAVCEAIAACSQRHAVRMADHSPGRTTGAAGIGIDPVALLAGGLDPVEAVSRAGAGLVSARLADLDDAGQRVRPGLGRLDLVAYKVALSLSETDAVVVDLQQLVDPVSSLESTCRAWQEGGGW